MKMIRWFVMGAALATGAAFAAGDEWQPAIGPLKTRWAKDVAPGKVWTEYPRPQMVRKDWLNLNGLWDYTIIDTNVPSPSSYQGKILVPFPVESALSGVMRRLDEKHHLVYRRTFKLPGSWKGRHVLLQFGAADWQTEVFINSESVGTHRGGYDPFTFDITTALKSGPVQEILVDIFDPTEGGQPRGKQVRKPEGICYTPTSGIWQTVWLEPVPELNIVDLFISPDVDHSLVRVVANCNGVGSGDLVEAVVSENGKEIGRKRGGAWSPLEIPIPHPKLWSPNQPFLYDLKIELRNGHKRLDAVTSYFAMRKTGLGKDAKGRTRLMLNGEPIFEIGTLDQGFWPDGIYTAPSDTAMRYDIETTKKLGFNMIRKHVKVEPDRWYYYCDKLGMIVWQDMPSAFLSDAKEDDKEQFEQELRQLIYTHRNHPCITTWVLFNEGWGQYDTVRLARMLKESDPSRLVDDASGWTDQNVGDLIDMHKYPGPDSPKPETNRAAVLGEFGGLGLGVDGHTWAKKTWGYQGMDSRKALTERYVNLLSKALELKESAGLSAAVYTQTTDVETECNGLMTYDREIVKPDEAAVAAANRKLQTEGR
jgi:beta-galactosidase/beta-glucuronidase